MSASARAMEAADELQRQIVERNWKTEDGRRRHMGALMPAVYWSKLELALALDAAYQRGAEDMRERAERQAQFEHVNGGSALAASAAIRALPVEAPDERA